MALTKKEKTKQSMLHGELRGFLAAHRIKRAVAAEFYDETYGNFVECLNKEKYSIEKIQDYLDKKEELLDFATKKAEA